VVTVFQDDFFGNSISVDECPICAAEILQADREIIEAEDTMVAADSLAIGAKLTVMLATDEKPSTIQRDYLPWMLSSDNRQFGRDHKDCNSGEKQTLQPATVCQTLRRGSFETGVNRALSQFTEGDLILPASGPELINRLLNFFQVFLEKRKKIQESGDGHSRQIMRPDWRRIWLP
jgi:hypothetical protein